MDDPPIRRVEARCYRYPLATPVVTSFGRMLDRPMVLVRIEDEAGTIGWGEAWCNFPSVGAEHRARLVGEILAPMLVGAALGPPGGALRRLTEATAVLALQAGEPGPIAQAIAALDIAHWDLAARRAGTPLWRLLGGGDPTIRVYASGINPSGARETAARARAQGHRAFKLKVGFAPDQDLANLAGLREEIGDLMLAADANQAWSVETAARRIADFAPFGLAWLEEPVRADTPWARWRPLLVAGGPPLAGGENLAGEAAFEAAVAAGILGVIQPDIAKWGGLSLCARVARTARAAGRRVCPHYLGGGIGLLASAHLLAGLGGDGLLEIDVNDNGLRDLCCGPVRSVVDGTVTLGEAPGLGLDPDLGALDAWRTL